MKPWKVNTNYEARIQVLDSVISYQPLSFDSPMQNIGIIISSQLRHRERKGDLITF
jgi:hypothetical protein